MKFRVQGLLLLATPFFANVALAQPVGADAPPTPAPAADESLSPRPPTSESPAPGSTEEAPLDLTTSPPSSVEGAGPRQEASGQDRLSGSTTPSAETTLGGATTPDAPSNETAASATPEAPGKNEDPQCAERWVRDGFYLRALSAPSYVGLTGDGPRGEPSISGFGSGSLVALGASVARGFVVAAALGTSTVTGKFRGGPFVDATVTAGESSTDASPKATAAMMELGLLLDWYPDPRAGWHAGLSGGLGITTLMHQADDSVALGTGFAASLFGGYDWSIGPQWSMGLGLLVSGTSTATMKDSDAKKTGYELRSLTVGLAGSILHF